MKRLAATATAVLAFGAALVALFGGNTIMATDVWRFGIAGAISSVSIGAMLMQNSTGLVGENADLRRALAATEDRLKSLQVELGRLEAWRTDAVADAEAVEPNGAS